MHKINFHQDPPTHQLPNFPRHLQTKQNRHLQEPRRRDRDIPPHIESEPSCIEGPIYFHLDPPKDLVIRPDRQEAPKPPIADAADNLALLQLHTTQQTVLEQVPGPPYRQLPLTTTTTPLKPQTTIRAIQATRQNHRQHHLLRLQRYLQLCPGSGKDARKDENAQRHLRETLYGGRTCEVHPGEVYSEDYRRAERGFDDSRVCRYWVDEL